MSATPFALSDTTKVAHEFLSTIQNPRAPWADAFERFADERGLDVKERHAVKRTVLELRMFATIERTARRSTRASH